MRVQEYLYNVFCDPEIVTLPEPVAWLFKRYGPGMKDFIEKRFALVTTIGTIVLVGGFVAIKYLLH